MTALAGQFFLADRHNRTLALAVVGSVLLHVALVLLVPLLRERQERNEAAEPIVARFVEPRIEPAAAASPRAEPLAQVSTPSVAASPQAPVRTKPKLQPAVKPALMVPIARESPKAEALPADAGTLAQYRLALMSAARSQKTYPRSAMENSWQGKVEVRMAIGIDGSIAGLSVLSSTGHALLDREALDMIERAKAAAHIPPALRGRQFVVDITVEFKLPEGA